MKGGKWVALVFHLGVGTSLTLAALNIFHVISLSWWIVPYPAFVSLSGLFLYIMTLVKGISSVLTDRIFKR